MTRPNIPVPQRLLGRQVSLIRHLTSADAIFGGGRRGVVDQALERIDPNLLRLEARFSHDKRMEKIAAVFPRTLALLGGARGACIAAFTAACPPTDISRIENARQFHGFLSEQWRAAPATPPYLPDIAAFELACAATRAAIETRCLFEHGQAGIRRKRGVVLLRTAYDLSGIFGTNARYPPPLRDSRLAIAGIANAGAPLIFDLTAEVFDLLAALDQWTDPAAFSDPDAEMLIADLADKGLVELVR
jgi:hypothetical protein